MCRSKALQEGHVQHLLTIVYMKKEMREGHNAGRMIVVLAKGDRAKECLTSADICVGKCLRRQARIDVA